MPKEKWWEAYAGKEEVLQKLLATWSSAQLKTLEEIFRQIDGNRTGMNFFHGGTGYLQWDKGEVRDLIRKFFEGQL